ncbi:hypothetical protein PZA11_007481 [Diplocarpon coronariae]|uniref:Cysteine dioxygenase n=1 Tax=Diplocarpon coronariae TaxID=2795749 RepID=A0A218Z690_9HELO|nr:hypothetical protein JHW43_008180 [Diplocarpon mali]OWP03214.1 hypothetical protein B2J93_7160 [Marssonina coronariae]
MASLSAIQHPPFSFPLPPTADANAVANVNARTDNNNTTPFSALVAALTHSLTTTPSPHLPTLTALLRDYASQPEHWRAYAHADRRKQYTRNLVAEVPGVFNLLMLVWTPGKKSPVHDHADSHCLMKILQGELMETRFAMPEGGAGGETSAGASAGAEDAEGAGPGKGGQEGLRETQRTLFREDKVAYISDQLGLHEMRNPSMTEFAVSLHLYTPPNAAMYGCHVFDPETGEARHVVQGAYDSIRGVVM